MHSKARQNARTVARVYYLRCLIHTAPDCRCASPSSLSGFSSFCDPYHDEHHSWPQPDPNDLKPKYFMGMEIPFSDGQNKDRFMALFQVAASLDRPSLSNSAANVNYKHNCCSVCNFAFVNSARSRFERGIDSVLGIQSKCRQSSPAPKL